jgi:hypothetical protein
MNVAEILANAVKGVCPKPSRRIPEGPLPWDNSDWAIAAGR